MNGSGREEFLPKIEVAFEDLKQSLDILESRDTTTGHATLIMGTLLDVALECFSQATTRPDYERQLDERKWQLLKQRKQLLTEVTAQDVEQAEHDLSADAKKLGDAIRSYTKALHYWRRRRGRERQAFTEAELREAWKRRDVAM
eukprot:7662964-Pyramimonas_sp.AAC.1